ncbi:LysR family transcriptional regulator [Paraglaciecola aquimarina]|uniref:LysR family transcriptional regulator n=1 Tax=Paraglaciecola aquimarina TaxID=1235557 RepID=A0ABU3SUV1_9ALTE|nr:LysR family transcriptional regulator [Paraglaciecola aquimarina]MDU0353727.1 LysR family transcriptional regulator [Paraglaciecola aquimarina]
MDKITAIKSFVEVARCGSFTKTAEHLSLSRLQVTRHVQEIEQWLSLRLFHRTTRKVSLTLQGEEALSYCQQILSTVSDLQSRAHSHNHELVGTIRIASPIGLGQYLLFDMVEQFTSMHPQTNIQLVLSDNLSQLVDERVDVALRYMQQPDEHHIARKLMHIDSVLCASKAYLASSPLLDKPEDLGNHNCLVHTSATKWRITSNGINEQIVPKGNLQANEMSVLVKAAVRGMGIANIPCDLANQHLQSGELIEVLPEYSSPGHNLWAVYLSRSYQQTVVRAFIDFLAESWHRDIKKCGDINPY